MQWLCPVYVEIPLCITLSVCVCPVCLPIFVCTHCMLCMFCAHVFFVLCVCPLPCVCANTSGPATETHRWLVQPVNQPTNQAEGPFWKYEIWNKSSKMPNQTMLLNPDWYRYLDEVVRGPLFLIGPRSNLSKLVLCCWYQETFWIIVLWFQTSFILSHSTPRMGSLCLWQCLEKWDHHIPWKMASPLKIQTIKNATNASWWLVRPVN